MGLVRPPLGCVLAVSLLLAAGRARADVAVPDGSGCTTSSAAYDGAECVLCVKTADCQALYGDRGYYQRCKNENGDGIWCNPPDAGWCSLRRPRSAGAALGLALCAAALGLLAWRRRR